MESTKPILGYWKIRGLAQQIRYMLTYLNVEFQEQIYELKLAEPMCFKVWTDKQDSIGLDFVNLPYFIDGDYKLTESGAIMKYIAAKYDSKLLGVGAHELGHVEMMFGVIMDMKIDITVKCYTTEDKELTAEFVHGHLKGIEKYLGSKKFLVGDNVTYVDFIFFELLNLCDFVTDGKLFEEHGTIKAYVERVKDLPHIRAFYEGPGT